MPLEEYHEGQRYAVYAYVRGNGSCPVSDYLAGLAERQRRKVDALLKRSAEHGPPRNREQCAPLQGESFFEFKAHQVRIFWRYAGRRIVLFHGFTKKSNRTPKREMATGRQRWRETVDELG